MPAETAQGGGIPWKERGVRHQHSVSYLDLMARAARLHYEFELTHEEAAEALSLSRVKVTRLLKQAREAGIVKITITTDARPFAELEERLVGDFGLTEAIVVPSGNGTEDELRSGPGSGGRLLPHQSGQGRSRGSCRAEPDDRGDPEVARQSAARPRHLRLARGRPAHRGRWQRQSVPGDRRLRDCVRRHGRASPCSGHRAQRRCRRGTAPRSWHSADSRARSGADIAFAGVGGRDDRISFAQGVDLSAAEWDELIGAGMVGDVGARFFDLDGMPLNHNISRRVIGLSLDQFKKIPNRVVAAGGPTKAESLQAALRGGIITVLVTDASTARSLLKLD